MTRNQRHAFFSSVAVVGGLAIGLSSILAFGRVRHGPLDAAHIVAGTLVVTIAMAWAFFFATRAHFANDEFKRQREVSTGYWGGWMGIAATAPVFVVVAITAFGRPAAVHIPPIIIFTAGYILAPLGGLFGAVGAHLWTRYRDR